MVSCGALGPFDGASGSRRNGSGAAPGGFRTKVGDGGGAAAPRLIGGAMEAPSAGSAASPFGVFGRDVGSGGDSPAGFWTAAASPASSGGGGSVCAGVPMEPASELYQWKPVGVNGMVDDGGAGIVYEYDE